MRNWIETTGKTVEEALLEASVALKTTEENIDYEVIDEGGSGFLGLNKKPAKIKAAVKETKLDKAADFISDVLNVMGIKNEVKSSYDEAEMTMNFEIVGDDMGVLIGKRGQTLDSLQYLVSLVVNKESDDYIKVKLDTENYRERRKQTLENLAKNIGSKVKKSGKPVALEPMNPYERRIIHSCLQGDAYVETHSEGEDPFRKVVITLKKGVRLPDNNRQRFHGGRKPYGNSNNKKKISSSREFHKKYGADTKDYSTDYKKDNAEYLESKAAAKAAAEKKEENA
jgi:spoIIIJ-associated protein